MLHFSCLATFADTANWVNELFIKQTTNKQQQQQQENPALGSGSPSR